MTATNMSSDFGGFRSASPLNLSTDLYSVQANGVDCTSNDSSTLLCADHLLGCKGEDFCFPVCRNLHKDEFSWHNTCKPGVPAGRLRNWREFDISAGDKI